MSLMPEPGKPESRTAAAGPARICAMPGRAETDAALVRRISEERDREALDALARHYGPRLKGWLMNRGEQEHTAEDIVQDVMVTVWLKASQFSEDRGGFSTWLYRLARNRWIDQKRKNNRVQPTDFEVISQLADAVVPAVDGDYDRHEAAKAVHAELALLSPEQKHILHLAFFEGLSHSQIAERTGLALGTVKSRIRAPLKKMQYGLKAYSEFLKDG